MKVSELQAELLTRAQLGGESFQLGFVFCDSPAGLDRLVESLQTQLVILQPPVHLEVIIAQNTSLTEAAFHAFETFQHGMLWLALQRSSDAELRRLLTRMNELRTGVIAKVRGMLVIAMRDNFDGELSAMVSDLWAVRSFAHTIPIIRDLAVDTMAFVDRTPSEPELPAGYAAPTDSTGIEDAFSIERLSLYEVDRLLQQAEIAARDLQPVAAIALITQALSALRRSSPSLTAFEITERALKLSQHLVSAGPSLSATQLLVNWIHLKPEAKTRVLRKHAEALIAVSAFASAFSILQDAPQVVASDTLARTAQGEALLGLGQDAEAVEIFDLVLKIEQRADSAASTRSYAGLAQAFVNISGYRSAWNILGISIPALERRILRRGNAPVRALRLAKMLSLERKIAEISEKPLARIAPEQILKAAILQFGPVPALEAQMAIISRK